MDLSPSKDGETQCTEFAHASLLSSQLKSGHGGCALPQYSKLYVSFLATDVASPAIDFSKKNVDDGVVDSPPSREPWRLLVLLASPLQGSPRIGHWHCSPSPSPDPSRISH